MKNSRNRRLGIPYLLVSENHDDCLQHFSNIITGSNELWYCRPTWNTTRYEKCHHASLRKSVLTGPLQNIADSCVSKYDRLNDIEIQLRDGEEIILEKRTSFPAQSMICSMRTQLTELQLSNGTLTFSSQFWGSLKINIISLHCTVLPLVALIVEEVEAHMKENQDLREKMYEYPRIYDF